MVAAINLRDFLERKYFASARSIKEAIESIKEDYLQRYENSGSMIHVVGGLIASREIWIGNKVRKDLTNDAFEIFGLPKGVDEEKIKLDIEIFYKNQGLELVTDDVLGLTFKNPDERDLKVILTYNPFRSCAFVSVLDFSRKS